MINYWLNNSAPTLCFNNSSLHSSIKMGVSESEYFMFHAHLILVQPWCLHYPEYKSTNTNLFQHKWHMRQKRNSGEWAYLLMEGLWINLALVQFTVSSFPFLKVRLISSDAQQISNKFSDHTQTKCVLPSTVVSCLQFQHHIYEHFLNFFIRYESKLNNLRV